MDCPHCHTRVHVGDRFCRSCGSPLSPRGGGAPATTTPGAKDPERALLLELVPGIAGVLGLGWAYVVSRRRGVLLMISWWGILALLIGALVGAARVIGVIGVLAILPFAMTVGVGVPLYSAFRVRSRARQYGTGPGEEHRAKE